MSLNWLIGELRKRIPEQRRVESMPCDLQAMSAVSRHGLRRQKEKKVLASPSAMRYSAIKRTAEWMISIVACVELIAKSGVSDAFASSLANNEGKI